MPNDYDMISLVGNGPHGSVWRACQRGTGEEVAAKLLLPSYGDDGPVRERLTGESAVLTAHLHPAFVRLGELIVADEVALITELVDGVDIRGSGPLAPEIAVRIGGEIAEALAAAHAEGVVHCDLKPSNVLMTHGSGRVRLTDLRVARLVRGPRARADQFADPRYAAPEVILGGTPIAASDVYGLGLVLHELLTGTSLAADGDGVLLEHVRGLSVDLPDQAKFVESLLGACLAPDPAYRPDAAEVREQLHALRTGNMPPGRRPRRHSVAAGVALAEIALPVQDSGIPFAVGEPSRPPRGRRPRRKRERSRPRRRAGWPVRQLTTAFAVLLVVVTVAAIGHDIWRRDRHATVPATGAVASQPPALPSPSAAPLPFPAGPPPSTGAEPTAPNPQGAAAFVRYWFAVLNDATARGSSDTVRAISDPQCQPCSTEADTIQAGYQAGGSLRGGQYVIRNVVSADFFVPGRPVTVDVVFDRTPQSSIAPDGTVHQIRPGTTFASCQMVLIRAADRWRVLQQLCDPPID